MLENELSIARSAALNAGRTILEFYATDFAVAEKQGADRHYEPVTEADITASQIIVNELAEAFPDDAILSEEEEDDVERRLSRDRVWIIDPLDGTAGFVRNDGDFAVQIGLAVGGVPRLGVVYLPFYEVLLYAIKNEGSFLVRKGREPVRTRVSDRQRSDELRLAMSRNHPSPRMGKIIETFGFESLVRRGSVGLKVGLIAEQICDIYIHPSPRTKLWDTCAPQVILEEAGGRFTDLFGEEIRYDRLELQNQNGILATNGSSHAVAVEIMKPLLVEFGRVPYQYDVLPPASSAKCV
jgi:3'(2'), 5'-bisphosphate nucleotidase